MSDVTVALVTGASRGIGKAIALTLGRQGYSIAGTATTEQGAKAISLYLQEQGITGAGFCLDVCDALSVAACVKEVAESLGTPSVLINNAGVTDDNVLLRMRGEQWDQVIATNLSSLYHLTKACLKPMVKARWGRVVNVSSVVALTGNAGQANYCASKAGMIGFTKSLALEYAARGITFNVVAPGFIETDMTSALTDQQKDNILQKIPMQQMGKAEDVAAAVAFLVSDQARYISGQSLHVNGAMYMS